MQNSKHKGRYNLADCKGFSQENEYSGRIMRKGGLFAGGSASCNSLAPQIFSRLSIGLNFATILVALLPVYW